MSPVIDVIVPAYQEAENIKPLIERISQVREQQSMNINVFIVDDNSQDGTEQAVADIALDWVKLLVRKTDRGLSSAVLAGLAEGTGDIVLVMDADLSHPAEAIPSMVAELQAGADFVVGSRYVEGGSTDDNWGFYRWLNSQIATLLARPFVKIKDPMSGFFAMPRRQFSQAKDLNPIGYKIGLELIVKCACKRVVEVPIHFTDRVRGESKLTLIEQLKYVQHVRRLFLYKYAGSSEVVQFLAVGASGVAVNLGVLSLLVMLGMSAKIAVVLAIAVSVVTNFLLNRRFTFSHSRDEPVASQFLKYALSVSAGTVVNIAVALSLVEAYPDMKVQLASFVGIVAATLFNFTAMKFLVFKRRFYKEPDQ
jgi:dolichol-phosphate mannosyltransferase